MTAIDYLTVRKFPDADLWRAFRAEAVRQNKTTPVLLAEAIREYLERHAATPTG